MSKRSVFFTTFVVMAPAIALIATNFGRAAATSAPGFHAPVSMPESNGGTEPSMAIGAQGRAGERLVSWQVPGEVATSKDGVNFTNKGQPDGSDGGGDVTASIDPSGAFYLGQFCGSAFELHACLERSLDGATTWSRTDFADTHPGAADRPWIEIFPHRSDTVPWDPDTTRVYLEYHTFTPEELAYVTVSEDGGQTFSEPKLITGDNTNAVNGSGCNTIPGGLAVDDNDGTVYALWLSGNDVASNVVTGCNYTQIGPFNKAWVSTSTDGGDTWTANLAWVGTFDDITKIGDNADKIFPTITVDAAGQVHVLLPVRHDDDPVGFVADCTLNGAGCTEDPQDTDLVIVTSPDAGAHWTLPAPIENQSGSYFFPWSEAGAEGVIDAVFYKSSSRQPNKPDSIWHIGFTRVTGAIASYVSGPNATYLSPPAFDEQLLDPDPVHGNGTSGGGLCTFGIFCTAVPGANRSLADSIDVVHDPAGGVNANWTDDIGNPGGAKLIYAICQNSGASAYAGAPDLNGCYGPADLQLTKTGPASVVAGGQLTYQITVTNNSVPSMPSTTSGVIVTDTLPAGVTLVSATPGSGSCTGTAVVSCDLGILPGDAVVTIDIVVDVSAAAAGSLSNTASVVSLTDDPNAADNTATVVTTIVPDTDGDLIGDDVDNCPATANADQSDVDTDGVGDVCDNCLIVANASQCDSDVDTFGNDCDSDFDQNNITNQIDLGIMRARLGTMQPDPFDIADLDCNGVVNQIDLGILRGQFGSPPGPTGLP